MDNAADQPNIEGLRQQVLADPRACALLAYRLGRSLYPAGLLAIVWTDPGQLERLVHRAQSKTAQEVRDHLARVAVADAESDARAQQVRDVREAARQKIERDSDLLQEITRQGARIHKDTEYV